MPYQTGKNLIVGYKVEATINTAPGATSAEVLRLTPSPGLSLAKESIDSQEIRSDGLTQMGRHGSRSVSGSFSGEVSVNSWDTILEALFRTTAVALTSLTQATASLASISFTSNTVVATNTSTGSGFLEAGIRVGDVFTLASLSGDAVANDGVAAQVLDVATHTITVASNTFTAAATAVTSFDLYVGKKFSNPATPVKRTFYVDQYYQDIDLSQVFGGFKWTGFTVTGSPNGMAEIEVRGQGIDMEVLASGASPYYSSPTTYSNNPLVFADAVIMLNGVTVVEGTAFSLSYDIEAAVPPVIGSNTAPDVFDNDVSLTGTLSLLREDLDILAAFDAETEYELHIRLTDSSGSNTTAQDMWGLFVPRVKFNSVDAPLGSDGPMVESVSWTAGLKFTAAGYDQTMLTITEIPGF